MNNYRLTFIPNLDVSEENNKQSLSDSEAVIEYCEQKDTAKEILSTLNTLIEYTFLLKWNCALHSSKDLITIEKKVDGEWIIITEEQLDEDVSNEK